MTADEHATVLDGDEIQRLLSDLRTLSPAGIERIAWGWDRHEGEGAEGYSEAERAALHAIEGADRGPAWEELRRRLLASTEGGMALTSWRAEHGEHGHKAERAVYGAALGLLAADRLAHQEYAALVRPLAEALPWLLPESPPTPYRPH